MAVTPPIQYTAAYYCTVCTCTAVQPDLGLQSQHSPQQANGRQTEVRAEGTVPPLTQPAPTREEVRADSRANPLTQVPVTADLVQQPV